MKKPFIDLLSKTKKTIDKLQKKVEHLQQEDIPEETPIPQPPEQPKKQRVLIEISPVSVAKSTIVILLLITAGTLIVKISNIIIIFFVAFLLAGAMEPVIDWLQKRKIPRGLGVLVFYILGFTLLGITISQILPLLAQQISELASKVGILIENASRIPAEELPFGQHINESIENFLNSINIDEVVDKLQSNLQIFAQQLFALGGNLWEVVKVLSNGLINLFMVLIVAFFMTVEKKSIEHFILTLAPTRHATYVADRLTVVKRKIGHWLRGTLILMITVGLLIYIGLKIFGVQYAAVLAMIAGLLEIIPVLGPPLSWLIAVPIVANQSPWLILWLMFLYGTVQLIENSFLVPIVMQRVIGLNTIVTLFALLVGARFLGILGIIISIPVATIISIFIDDYMRKTPASKKKT